MSSAKTRELPALQTIPKMDYFFNEYNSAVLQKVDGFYQLDKDKQALENYLLYVKNQTKVFKSPSFMIGSLCMDGYLEYSSFRYYDDEYINELDAHIRGLNFQFQSFMQAFKFYNDYSLKDKDGKWILCDYNSHILILSLFLACGEIENRKPYDIAFILIKQLYQPATPTFLNASRVRGGQLVSCFLLSMEDSLTSILDVHRSAGHLSKIGGGLAINLSNLRATASNIGRIAKVGKGVVPVMKLLEDLFNYADQMGQRRGAGAVYLNIFHEDIVRFLETKKINSDEKSRIQTLSQGVIVPDKFFELLKENRDICLINPKILRDLTSRQFTDLDFSKDYDRLALSHYYNQNKINSRDLCQLIAKMQFESGYPYLIFIDNANRANPLAKIGKIQMSNLCTEIFQTQLPVIPDGEFRYVHNSIHPEYKGRGLDISCILGSLNIVNLLKNAEDMGHFFQIVDSASRALSTVSIRTEIQHAPSIDSANFLFRSIGLGVMNLQGFFVLNDISYESLEALDFCDCFFALLNYCSLKSSNEQSKDTRKRFWMFKNSTYSTGEYFKKYEEQEYQPKTSKVREIFKKFKLPTIADWRSLKNSVMDWGLFNAYRLAIAPTQSIACLQNSTPSVMPVTEHVETRIYGNSTTYFPAPFLTKENICRYELAHNINQYKLLTLISRIQPHIDQGISTTLYIDDKVSTRDLMKYYVYAHKIGLKSLYYARSRDSVIEECQVCSL